MLKKLFIVPWTGGHPEWIDKYKKNIEPLKKYGFEWLLVTDMEDFKDRARKLFNLEPVIVERTIKSADFHPMMGLMYAEELKGYDFWGHTDLDVVYGNLSHYVSDEFLKDCDIYGNDPDATCGPFTLYRNEDKINNLFKKFDGWREMLSSEKLYLFDEVGISKVIREARRTDGVRFKTNHWLDNERSPFNLSIKDDCLFNNGKETMMFHFNDSKKYPEVKYE